MQNEATGTIGQSSRAADNPANNYGKNICFGFQSFARFLNKRINFLA